MSLKNKTYQVLRANTGAYNEAGDYVTTRVETSITGTIQPNKPGFQEIVNDPKLLARDIWASIKIFSNEPLYPMRNEPSRKADVVIFNEKMYEVKSVSGERKLGRLKTHHSTADFIGYLDDGDGEPIVGNPYQAHPYEKWIDFEDLDDGIITTITTTFILSKKVKPGSLILYIGSVPRVEGDFTLQEDGITVIMNTAPAIGKILKARGTPTNVQA
jgi:hypothetical protein